MLGATVVVVIAAVLLFVKGTDAIRKYTAAKRADAGLPVDAVPDTPTAMFATVDGANTLTSVAVFVLAPSLSGGSIVSVPVNADSTQGIGQERLTLRDAYASDGATGLVQALESTLSMSVDYFSVDDPAQAAGVLLPVSPVDVTLPRTVVADARGTTTVVFNRGQRAMPAPDAVQVLTALSSTVDEAARTPNIEAVWSAVATSIGAGKPGDTLSPTVTSFQDLVAHLYAGQVGARGLPLGAFPADAPGVQDTDVALLDRSEEILVFASIAPGSMSRPAAGLAIRVVAPSGSEAKVKEAISVLLYLGENIASVDLTGNAQDSTQLFVYDESSKSATDGLKPYFGDFSYGTPTSQPDGVDATIVLGNDFLASTQTVTTPVTTSTTIAAADGAPTGTGS
ncbi:MAG: hypothetical protein JWM12_2067 [Ilumatobacteraceae bacterium]|nr:hypothetical protein [Ilumatobacteraceae bacterium]